MKKESQSIQLVKLALAKLTHSNRLLVLREFDAYYPEEIPQALHESVIKRAESLS
jgi:hypothetical protein